MKQDEEGSAGEAIGSLLAVIIGGLWIFGALVFWIFVAKLAWKLISGIWEWV